MEMEFQRERLTSGLIRELGPLLLSHYKEIARFKDIELEPDFNEYQALDDIGVLRIFTARKAGNLVGYAVYFVRSNPHYKSSLQAVQDILFIHPKHRGTGGKLIRYCDDELRKVGVQVVYHHVKKKHNFGPMLERMGYELIDLIYGKRL